MNIGKLFLGLGLCLVFLVVTLVVAMIIELYVGIDENIVWFIFGGCYFQTAQKMGL